MAKYSDSVFLNCPFDDQHKPIRLAILFAIFDCGFVPRCALEVDDGTDVRFEKIKRLISSSRYGIHDICRTEIDANTALPRFNMPLELGVFLAAKSFGIGAQKQKSCLILDRDLYRYRNFISDIAGHDIRSHQNDADQAIIQVRNWLGTASGRVTLPGGRAIVTRYRRFMAELPDLCADLNLEADELTYSDYINLVSGWLSASPLVTLATR
jgi:hypothetical protein